MNSNNSEHIKWGGALNEFLWVCCGVNRKVIRQCPTDYAKYAGMGGTILFTAIMASLSGSYALFSVFDNTKIAVCFGIFWGMLIFNLDRFIVNTMYSDEKVTISWQEFKCGLPRIIMAIFLGIVISTPLELKIFEDAIDIRIEQDKDRLLDEKIKGSVMSRDSILRKRDEVRTGTTMFDSQITTNNTKTNSFLDSIRNKRDQMKPLKQKREVIIRELSDINNKIQQAEKANMNSTNLHRRKRGIVAQKKDIDSKIQNLESDIRDLQGRAAASNGTLEEILKSKQNEQDKECARLEAEADTINKQIEEAKTRHNDWDVKTIKEKGSFRDKLDMEYKGFQAKMSAFSELKEEDTSMMLASTFIMLLFVIIETAPTFFKMMIASGPYDDMLRAETYRIRVLADKQISDINDDINTEISLSTERNKQKLEAEQKANEELMSKIAKAQSEILSIAIEKWREQELKKVEADPSAYIQSELPQEEKETD